MKGLALLPEVDSLSESSSVFLLTGQALAAMGTSPPSILDLALLNMASGCHVPESSVESSGKGLGLTVYSGCLSGVDEGFGILVPSSCISGVDGKGLVVPSGCISGVGGEALGLTPNSGITSGVDGEALGLTPNSGIISGVDGALGLCNTGDLLLIFADKITRSWKQIIYHHSILKQAETTVEKKTTVSEEMILDQEMPFLQDERGVFVPHEEQAD